MFFFFLDDFPSATLLSTSQDLALQEGKTVSTIVAERLNKNKCLRRILAKVLQNWGYKKQEMMKAYIQCDKSYEKTEDF